MHDVPATAPAADIARTDGTEGRAFELIPAIALGLAAITCVTVVPLFQTAGLDRVAVVFPADGPPAIAFQSLTDAGALPVDVVRLPGLGVDVWLAAPPEVDRLVVPGALAVLNPYALGGCLLGTAP